jgi:hypothetical protein
VREEKCLVPTVEADRGIEEGDSRGWKVHDVVVECVGLVESDGRLRE